MKPPALARALTGDGLRGNSRTGVAEGESDGPFGRVKAGSEPLGFVIGGGTA